MAGVAIVGESGTGKSTSLGNFPEIGIKGLNPSSTVIINVANKPLPFKGWSSKYKEGIKEKGNYLVSSDADVIASAIKFISDSRKDITDVVIDDGQYIMAFEFMARAKETGYGKFSDIGVKFNKIVQTVKDVRKDLNVFFLWHPQKDNLGNYSMKTVGKMVDDYLTPEGLFTIVLYSCVEQGNGNKMEYKFVTNNDGKYPAKSPMGMFNETYIKNDLGLVSDKIREFNN